MIDHGPPNRAFEHGIQHCLLEHEIAQDVRPYRSRHPPVHLLRQRHRKIVGREKRLLELSVPLVLGNEQFHRPPGEHGIAAADERLEDVLLAALQALLHQGLGKGCAVRLAQRDRHAIFLGALHDDLHEIGVANDAAALKNGPGQLDRLVGEQLLQVREFDGGALERIGEVLPHLHFHGAEQPPEHVLHQRTLLVGQALVDRDEEVDDRMLALRPRLPGTVGGAR